jgi:CRP/FNR family transcriptional regulator, cyclic AMP receptor protein
VKVTVVSEQGKEAVVAIHGTNDFFGEGCLTSQALRIATVRTLTESIIVRLEKAAIIQVIHQEPAFAEMFIAHLLGRNIRVEADLVDQLFNSSEKRLARLLLLLANFGKDGKSEPIIAKISQETLAEMIGTTRSRVSFFMNKFRNLGAGATLCEPIHTCTRGRTGIELESPLCPFRSEIRTDHGLYEHSANHYPSGQKTRHQ